MENTTPNSTPFNSTLYYFVSNDSESFDYYNQKFDTRYKAVANGMKTYPDQKFYIARGYELNWFNAFTGNFVEEMWQSILESLCDAHYEGVTANLPDELTQAQTQLIKSRVFETLIQMFGKSLFGYQLRDETETITSHLTVDEVPEFYFNGSKFLENDKVIIKGYSQENNKPFTVVFEKLMNRLAVNVLEHKDDHRMQMLMPLESLNIIKLLK